MGRVLVKKAAAVAAMLISVAVLSTAVAGAKPKRVQLSGVVVKVIPPTIGGNGPRTISALYRGKKKVGKLNFSSDCALDECVEGGYVHIKGFKVKGERFGTLYGHFTDKLHGIPPKGSKSAVGTLCVSQKNDKSGCVAASITPASIASTGTHFKLVIG
jgi:hypothetical protein